MSEISQLKKKVRSLEKEVNELKKLKETHFEEFLKIKQMVYDLSYRQYEGSSVKSQILETAQNFASNNTRFVEEEIAEFRRQGLSEREIEAKRLQIERENESERLFLQNIANNEERRDPDDDMWINLVKNKLQQ